jgi:hypothetical protein
MVKFTPHPVYLGKGPGYPLYKWIFGPQRNSGRFGKENNFLPLPIFKSRTFQPVNIVAIQNTLLLLQY